MICPACSGKVTETPTMEDQLGYCEVCSGLHLKKNRKTVAQGWCSCKDFNPEDTRYWWTDTAHGWLHLNCGQITQIG